MLHTQFRGSQSAGSGEDFFTIHGHCGHLGHVTSIMLINFHFHVPKSSHAKYGLNGTVVSEKSKF